MIGEQKPRICYFPDYVSSAGEEAIDLARIAGLELDEWQRFVLTNALGERPDGSWAAPTVGLVVARQNGKNAVLEARELAGLFLLGEKTLIHSAHEQATSSEHFRKLLGRIESVPEFSSRVLKVTHGKGSEAIELRGGQRILFKTRTGGGGRGFTIDFIAFDEAMILSASAKAALVPAMSGRSMESNLQTWYTGSAVDQMNPKHDGVELARIREQGVAGKGRVAYFEWSAPGENPDRVTDTEAADPVNWRKANPGLEIRISEEWVEHERTMELGPREFAVERLGVGDWPATSGENQSVIPVAKWRVLTDPESKIETGLCFAFDVTFDRSRSCISAAGKRPDGLWHVEVVEARPGTGWVVSRLRELREKHHPAVIAWDKRGPGGSLDADLEEAGLFLTDLSVSDLAQACARISDHVEHGTLRHIGEPLLEQSIRSAGTRPLGDAWMWSRKASASDSSPLVSMTLALWAAETCVTGDLLYDFSQFLDDEEKQAAGVI